MDSKQSIKGLPEQAVNALMTVNEITYQMSPEIGITRSVTHQVDQFQQPTYSGGEMVLICQTGSAFVNTARSYLKFDFSGTLTGGSAPTFGSGSLANVFQDILIESRTGVDLDRLREAGLFIKNYQNFKHSSQWMATQGVAGGNPTKTDYKSGDATAVTARQTYCIPIEEICPIFRPVGGVLLPPQLMEGLRIRFQLADANSVMVKTGTTTASSYVISNARIVWEVCDLNDVFKRKIQEIAATRGLAVMYKSVHQQPLTVTSGSVNVEINKAVSKALKLTIIPRLSDNIGSLSAALDTYSSYKFDFKQAQCRIGNSYIPQIPLVTDDASRFFEFYLYTLKSLGYEDDQSAPSVLPVTAVGGYGSTDAKNSNSCLVFSLNKSSVNDLDGWTINNSRSLVVDMSVFTSGSAVRYDFFLEYLRVALVFTSNVDVKL